MSDEFTEAQVHDTKQGNTYLEMISFTSGDVGVNMGLSPEDVQHFADAFEDFKTEYVTAMKLEPAHEEPQQVVLTLTLSMMKDLLFHLKKHQTLAHVVPMLELAVMTLSDEVSAVPLKSIH